MAFKVELTQTGWVSLYRNVDYLSSSVGDTGNSQAALNFLNDLEYVIRHIEQGATSYAMIDVPTTPHRKMYKLHFPKMHYKVLYKVVGSTAYIVAILHDRQALENIAI